MQQEKNKDKKEKNKEKSLRKKMKKMEEMAEQLRKAGKQVRNVDTNQIRSMVGKSSQKSLKPLMVSLKSSSNAVVSQIAKSFMLPTEYMPIRTPGNGVATAVARPYMVNNLNFSDRYENDILVTGTAAIHLTDDPLHALCYTVPGYDSATNTVKDWSYIVSMSGPEGSGGGCHINTAIVNASLYTTPGIFRYVASADYNDNCDMYPWTVKGKPCFLAYNYAVVNKNLTFTFHSGSATNLPSGASFRLWFSDGKSEWAVCDAANALGSTTSVSLKVPYGANTNGPVNEPGFFYFEAGYMGSPSSAIPYVFYCNIFGYGDLFYAQPMAGIWDHEANFQALYRKGSSLLLNQVAPTMYEGGQIIARNNGLGFEFHSTHMGNIRTLSGNVSFNLKTGFYGFTQCDNSMKYASHLPFAYDARKKIEAGTPSDFDKVHSLSVCIQFPAIESKFVGLDLVLTNCMGMEFITTNTFFDLERFNVKSGDYSEAIDIVNKYTNLHENPLHWSDISNAVKWGLRTFGPKLAKFVVEHPAEIASYIGRAAALL